MSHKTTVVLEQTLAENFAMLCSMAMRRGYSHSHILFRHGSIRALAREISMEETSFDLSEQRLLIILRARPLAEIRLLAFKTMQVAAMLTFVAYFGVVAWYTCVAIYRAFLHLGG